MAVLEVDLRKAVIGVPIPVVNLRKAVIPVPVPVPVLQNPLKIKTEHLVHTLNTNMDHG
jgi:hypothetical protein